MRHQHMRIALLLIAGAAVLAQPQFKFEVTSVKPSAPGETGCNLRPAPGGQRYAATCLTLHDVIETAYWLHPQQILGGPPWVKSQLYDITGIAAKPSTILDLHAMMRNLLTERFQLQLHHESREQPAYVLTLDKNGPRNMRSHPPQYSSDLQMQSTRNGLHEKLSFTAAPMDYFALVLAVRSDRPPVNQTRLEGSFDFDLAYTNEPPPPAPGAKSDAPILDASGPTLAEALREQLGLRLEARQAPVDYLVIDRAERPTAN